ncbi:diguanylate cyclase [Sulfurimonas sp. HSL-1716]|uniref:diguanylate cyclase n=1 Tax=Hydrocurvibacter sulfurireducens TaxID=3131937 RepID=UPI0031FA343C
MSCFSNNNISYKTVFEHIPAASFIAKLKRDPDLSVDDLHFNKAFMQKFNTLETDLFSDTLINDKLNFAVRNSFETTAPQYFEHTLKNRDLLIHLRIAVDTLCMNETEFVTGIIEDISAHVDTTRKMHSQNKELQILNYELTSSKILIDKYIPISITDLDGVITDCNEAFCNLTGFTKEEVLGKKHNILKDEQTPQKVYKNFWDIIVNNETYIGELKNRKKDGTPFWIRTRVHPKYEKDGTKVGYISVREDITNTKHLEEKASMDMLTRVFNRNKFNDFIAKSMAEFHRYSKVSSLIICDIDHFKNVNDRYGHLIGDEILKEVAFEIKSSLRDSDVLGRWGGEEFIILLPNTSEKNAFLVANKILKAVAQRRFSVVENITISCGVSEVSKRDTLNVWFKRVDDALYKAKEGGRNTVVCI